LHNVSILNQHFFNLSWAFRSRKNVVILELLIIEALHVPVVYFGSVADVFNVRFGKAIGMKYKGRMWDVHVGG
jgi:hypothetical protein